MMGPKVALQFEPDATDGMSVARDYACRRRVVETGGRNFASAYDVDKCAE